MDKEKMNFALFGHGYHLCYLIEKLQQHRLCKPVIITHPSKNHDRDRRLLTDPKTYQDLFKVAEKFDIEVLETEIVNCEKVNNFLKEKDCNIAFATNCRSIISKNMIDFFNGNFFNIHPSYLPHERGTGTFSWRILNNSKEISGTIHYVDNGIDTGNIVLQKKEVIGKNFPIPNDYMKQTTKLFNDLIDKFFDNIDQIILSNGKTQSLDEGSYFPRLITEDNGVIDWSIKGQFIERTIRAFSYPYPGAYTYLNDKKVQILLSRFQEADHSLHPMMHGRIVNLSESGTAKVAVKGGYIFIDEVKKSGRFCKINELIERPGIFHTPILELEKSKNKNTPISKLKYS
tara:strand:- start:396 stop:1427 length:1032 start_codon:yes stop_codon:yes gene_type:complete